MDKFEFTQEQKEKLNLWKAHLASENAKRYAEHVTEASKNIQIILKTLELGNDLTAPQLDSLFREMRKFVNNRALANNLYSTNGISRLNIALRELLFGKTPLKNRINQFIDLKWVQETVVSHFLCVYSPMNYPVITKQTFDVLDLNDEQWGAIEKQAKEEFSIDDYDKYHESTTRYLEDFIVFREIKNFLNLNNYPQVNYMLWLQSLSQEEGIVDVETPFTSVSLESDLRDYLEKNIHLLERGLKVLDKEKTLESGRADLICQDSMGILVVVETKKNSSSDKVIGQTLRYMGSLIKNGHKARGIIVINEPDELLNAALIPVKDIIKLKYYKAKFEISDNYNSNNSS